MSTVQGSQTDMVLNPSMEGQRYITKLHATYVCLPTQDYLGLKVNLILMSEKMSSTQNNYPGTLGNRKD